MKITFVGRQMSVPEDIKLLAEKKLAKLDRYFSGEQAATLTLSTKRSRDYIEITISAANTFFRCETSDETFRNALDKAIDTIDRQIRKNKTRLESRLRSNAFAEDAPEEYLSEQKEDLVRVKSFPIKPMSAEEAILQMNLLGHQFFVFADDKSGETCVVYARKDGGYGLIIPEK